MPYRHSVSGSSLALSASGLTRIFRVGLRRKPQVALRGVDLAVRPGQTLGLVGPNGSGKSTLLRICAGVDRPTSGDVSVFGGPADGEVARGRVQFLPDGTPFPGELCALDALRLIASVRRTSRHRVTIETEAMLARVGLTGSGGAKLRTPLSGFSRGMHRRFGLAQAFLGNPSMVLLDEPTAGLDAPGFPVLTSLIEEARARGATIVMASHIASDFMRYCDELALLARGEIRRVAPPDELLGHEDAIAIEVREPEVARARAALGKLDQSAISIRPASRSLVDLYDEHDPGDRA